MTSGLLRNRKEVTERHREEGDKKMEERLEGRSHKLRTPRLAGSPQKLGQRPGRALNKKFKEWKKNEHNQVSVLKPEIRFIKPK